MTEQAIQTKIKAKLEGAGWMVIKLIQTNSPGIPDLMALRGGTTIFIEVKRPGLKPTDLQRYRHQQLEAEGFEVIVADSIEAIKHLLN